jgi:hypothetical protein
MGRRFPQNPCGKILCDMVYAESVGQLQPRVVNNPGITMFELIDETRFKLFAPESQGFANPELRLANTFSVRDALVRNTRSTAPTDLYSLRAVFHTTWSRLVNRRPG